jgi:hypothetical protein
VKLLPRLDWHIYKKQHDYDTNQLLSRYTSKYLDWEVVTLFYSAMHWVDAVICELRLNKKIKIPEPKEHETRNKIVVKFLKPIANEYKTLYHISRWARYEEVKIDLSILSAAKSSYDNIVKKLRSMFPQLK